MTVGSGALVNGGRAGRGCPSRELRRDPLRGSAPLSDAKRANRRTYAVAGVLGQAETRATDLRLQLRVACSGAASAPRLMPSRLRAQRPSTTPRGRRSSRWVPSSKARRSAGRSLADGCRPCHLQLVGGGSRVRVLTVSMHRDGDCRVLVRHAKPRCRESKASSAFREVIEPRVRSEVVP